MSAGTGQFVVPLPTFEGGTAPTGTFEVPMVTCIGYSSGSATFNIPIVEFEGSAGQTGVSGSYKAPVPTFDGTGLSTVPGTGQFDIPMATFDGTVMGVGTGLFTVPMPIFSDLVPGYPRGSFVIPVTHFTGEGRPLLYTAQTYRGVVCNITNQAHSTYSNLPFNSLAYFNGVYLGASHEGIFVIGGNKDRGRNILAKLKTGTMDFGDNFIKHLRDLWLTYKADGTMSIIVYADEDNKNLMEAITKVVGGTMHEEKVKCARGLRSRYYTIEISNRSGADFDLEKISAMVDSIIRKKR